MSEYIIETDLINRYFPEAGCDDFHALKDISIQVPALALSILRGRSGSGKTTLMNILGALDRPTSGKILFDNREITRLSERQRDKLRRKKIGFIFQSVSLIPNMTAYENVEFSLRLGSNPEFTGSVLVATARAVYRMASRGECGARTLFDVAPADLSIYSREELYAHML